METLSKIRVGVFALWGIIVAVAVLLCCLGLLPWWAGAGVVLFPVAVLLSALLWLCIGTLIGDALKSKNPPSCANCFWGRARDVAGHCMGETLGCKYGDPCGHYERDTLG